MRNGPMKAPDVYLYEVFEEEERLLRRHAPPWLRLQTTAATIQEAGHRQPPAPVISIRTQSVVPPEWLDRLRAILSRSAGYDHLLALQRKAGGSVQFGYLPRYCVRAVAEQACLLWMALLRRLPAQIAAFRSFRRDGLTGGECAGRVLAVVGVGNIGGEVVRIGRRLGMRVLGVDIVRRYRTVRYASPAEALSRADVIVAAMNLTEDNRGYFSYRRMQQAKPGAVFVNVARGELSPFEDLLRLLQEGRLGGVALDVYENEPQIAVVLRESGRPDDPRLPAALRELARRPDVILTPHNAFNTAEAVDLKAAHTIRQLVHFTRRGRFRWSIPALS